MHALILIVAFTVAPSIALAQNRASQTTTGAALAGLGVYAAFADRDCRIYNAAVLDSRCYHTRVNIDTFEREIDPWGGGEPQELPKLQVAGGLVAAGLGGMMAAGLWEPSREMDTLVAAIVGTGLLIGGFDFKNAPGTVHADFGGRRYSACARGNTITDRCTSASLARRGMMWAGVGGLGLAAVRWFWHSREPLFALDAGPGGVRVIKTFGF